MTIDINKLRRLAQAATPGPWLFDEKSEAITTHNRIANGKTRIATVTLGWLEPFESEQLANARLIAAANPAAITELLDRLEAAEKECESWKGLAKQFGNEADVCATHLYFAKDELNRLRARIEEMERQEPVAQVGVHKTGGNAGIAWSARPLNEFDSLPPLCDGDKLYLAPGAQPAQKEVAYLDLGTGGYMDIGTDLSDEQLASLPKGRHMLGIVGTYGVDGYVSAQPAPSVPENVMRDARRYLWLRNAALDWYVGPEYATYNDVVCSGECCNYAGGGVALDSAIDALLASAPEAKP